MTVPITTHCPLFASLFLKAEYLKSKCSVSFACLRGWPAPEEAGRLSDQIEAVKKTHVVTPAHSRGAASFESRASGIGVT